jgi:long-chain fatty acid transport protein
MKIFRQALSLAFIFSFVQQLWSVGSGGYTNQIVGAKALGQGNAFVATADDATAVFFNPAGIVQLEAPTATFGLAPHLYKTTYEQDNRTSEDSQTMTPVVPNAYYVYSQPNQKWAAGIGWMYPLGLKTSYSDKGALRYVATETDLKIMQINPVVSLRPLENLMLGFGLIYARTEVSLKSRINQTLLNYSLTGALIPTADGTQQASGSANGMGYNFGLLWKFCEYHRVGLNYRSLIKNKLKGSTELSDLKGASSIVFGGDKYSINTEAAFDLPQTLTAGYAFNWKKWTWELDMEWVDYSAFDRQFLEFKGETNPTRLAILNNGNPESRDWHSSLNFGFGANYKFNEAWQMRSGYYYFPSVAPEHTWEPSIPDSPRHGFTLGAGHAWGRWNLDITYNAVYFENRTIHNSAGDNVLGPIDGSYRTFAHILSLNLSYKFGQ